MAEILKNQDFQASDLIPAGQWFFRKMLSAVREQEGTKVEAYQLNPVQFVEYLRALPVKPSEVDNAHILPVKGLAIIDAAAGHPTDKYPETACVMAVMKVWNRISMETKPSKRTPVLTQILMAELWDTGHVSFMQNLLAWGNSDPADPASPLRLVEPGDYCDYIKSVTEHRLMGLMKAKSWDGVFPPGILSQDTKLMDASVSIIVRVLNHTISQLRASNDPHADGVDTLAVLFYRVFGLMRLSKVDQAAKLMIDASAQVDISADLGKQK